MLETLNKLNPEIKIYSVKDEEFKKYGRIINIDTKECVDACLSLDFPRDGSAYEPTVKALEDMNVVVGADPNLAAKIEIQDPTRMAKVLQKYFGQIDTYSIYFSACEQEEGAARKKKEKPDLTASKKASGNEGKGKVWVK